MGEQLPNDDLIFDETGQSADIVQRLQVLGPLMRVQERLEATTPDAEFVTSLRATLAADNQPQSQQPIDVAWQNGSNLQSLYQAYGQEILQLDKKIQELSLRIKVGDASWEELSTRMEQRRIARAKLEVIHEMQTTSTPALLVGRTVMAADYRRLVDTFRGVGFADGVTTFYAVKTNPHPTILRTLAAAGCGLEVASASELAMALAAGVPAQRLRFSTPFTREAAIAEAHRKGVTLFIAATTGDVEKIARHAPGARLLVRVALPGGQALSRTDADPAMVLPLLAQAHARGLLPWGLLFHVGSQCLEDGIWAPAIGGAAAPLWHAARAQNLPLTLLGIDGFPAQQDAAVPSIDAIAKAVCQAVGKHRLSEARLAIEAGRWLLQAVALVATVIGRACRGDEQWVYLDANIYNGPPDAHETIGYSLCTLDEVLSGRRRPRVRVTLVSHSCDGADVLWRNIESPTLEMGDRLLLFGIGDYTSYRLHAGFCVTAQNGALQLGHGTAEATERGETVLVG